MSEIRSNRHPEIERLCAELASRLNACKTTYAERLAADTAHELTDLERALREFLDNVYLEDGQYDEPLRPPNRVALRVIQGGAA